MYLRDDGDLELDKWQWKGSTKMILRWGGQRIWRGNKKRGNPYFWLTYLCVTLRTSTSFGKERMNSSVDRLSFAACGPPQTLLVEPRLKRDARMEAKI